MRSIPAGWCGCAANVAILVCLLFARSLSLLLLPCFQSPRPPIPSKMGATERARLPSSQWLPLAACNSYTVRFQLLSIRLSSLRKAIARGMGADKADFGIQARQAKQFR